MCVCACVYVASVYVCLYFLEGKKKQINNFFFLNKVEKRTSEIFGKKPNGK